MAAGPGWACLGVRMEPAGSVGWRDRTGQAQTQEGGQPTPQHTDHCVLLGSPSQKLKIAITTVNIFVALLCTRHCCKLLT